MLRHSGVRHCSGLFRRQRIVTRAWRNFSSSFDEEELRKKIQPIVPKKLGELVKLELFQDKTAEEVQAIWDGYHATKKDCVSTTLSPDEWKELEKRSKECPMFVLPVKKGEGKFFVLLSQWTETHLILTYLEEYQRNPNAALPYFYMVVYPDLAVSNGRALVRAEFLPYLTKEEAQTLLDESLDFYLRDDTKYQHVKTFNHNSTAFDFNKVFNL